MAAAISAGIARLIQALTKMAGRLRPPAIVLLVLLSPGAALAQSSPVEARLTAMHQQLRITRAQEPLWSDFAGIMRENATRMASATQARNAAVPQASAIDTLRADRTLAEIRLANLQRLEPAFAALYDGLSEVQKQAADIAVRQPPAVPGRSRRVRNPPALTE